MWNKLLKLNIWSIEFVLCFFCVFLFTSPKLSKRSTKSGRKTKTTRQEDQITEEFDDFVVGTKVEGQFQGKEGLIFS